MKEQNKNPSFNIDPEMVRHIAFLVRLGIVESEALAFSHEFNEIINYFHLLNEVETTDIPPACEETNTRNIMRSDEVKASMSREDFFKNVPQREGNYVLVPQVLDEG